MKKYRVDVIKERAGDEDSDLIVEVVDTYEFEAITIDVTEITQERE